jgi:hypothetical protein
MEKICCFCQNFGIDMGGEGWSEDTPGWNAEIGCEKEYWALTNTRDACEFSELIQMAKTCPDWIAPKPPRRTIVTHRPPTVWPRQWMTECDHLF